MLSIDLEEKLTLKIGGKEYQMLLPTGDQIDSFNEAVLSSEVKGKNEIKFMRNLFLELGLPDEIVSKLQFHNYQKIFEALLPKKN